MVVAYGANAQSDHSTYFDKAMEKIEAGDCNAAQKYYNIYKELTDKSISSFEKLIADCQKDKSYTVGDVMIVNGDEYKVAYVRDKGKHGLAVLEKGWERINKEVTVKTEYVDRKGIPTLEELKEIYKNRDILGMYGRYWSCTKVKGFSSTYKTIDFSTGEHMNHDGTYPSAIVLLIHRF